MVFMHQLFVTTPPPPPPHLGAGIARKMCHVFTFALSPNTRDLIWQCNVKQNILQGKPSMVLPAGCPRSVDCCTKNQSPRYLPWLGQRLQMTGA